MIFGQIPPGDTIPVGGIEELHHGVGVKHNSETGQHAGFIHVSVGPLEVTLTPKEAEAFASCMIRCSQKALYVGHAYRLLKAEGLSDEGIEKRVGEIMPMMVPDVADEYDKARKGGQKMAERILNIMGGRQPYSVEDLFREMGIGPDGPAKPEGNEGGDDDRRDDATGPH